MTKEQFIEELKSFGLVEAIENSDDCSGYDLEKSNLLHVVLSVWVKLHCSDFRNRSKEEFWWNVYLKIYDQLTLEQKLLESRNNQ